MSASHSGRLTPPDAFDLGRAAISHLFRPASPADVDSNESTGRPNRVRTLIGHRRGGISSVRSHALPRSKRPSRDRYEHKHRLLSPALQRSRRHVLRHVPAVPPAWRNYEHVRARSCEEKAAIVSGSTLSITGARNPSRVSAADVPRLDAARRATSRRDPPIPRITRRRIARAPASRNLPRLRRLRARGQRPSSATERKAQILCRPREPRRIPFQRLWNPPARRRHVGVCIRIAWSQSMRTVRPLCGGFLAKLSLAVACKCRCDMSPYFLSPDLFATCTPRNASYG